MPGYCLFDIETVPDGALIAATKYPNDGLTPEQAIERAENDAQESKNKSLSITHQVPICIVSLIIDQTFKPVRLIVLTGDVRNMVRGFWNYYDKIDPIIVSYNGRGFDLPILELMSFKHGLTIPPTYWAKYGPRNRYGDGHIDLKELLSNGGAANVTGGLNALSMLIGRQGKASADGLDGSKVYAAYLAGKLEDIVHYCIRDVIDTYAIFLRTRVMMGKLSIEDEAALIARAEERTPRHFDGCVHGQTTDGPDQKANKANTQ